MLPQDNANRGYVDEAEVEMKLVARINGESQQVVESLKPVCASVKLVRGGIIAELKELRNGSGQFCGYQLPEQLNGAKLFIDCSEHGGGMTNTGSGTVVCGMSGKALRPYYCPRGGHLACGVHAYFSVPETVVTVTGYRRDTKVTIEEHRISVTPENCSPRVARIATKQLWSGEAPAIEWTCLSCGAVFTDTCPDEHDREDGSKCYGEPHRSKLALPESFDRFQRAAQAARTKGNCYHCRCVHYAAAATS